MFTVVKMEGESLREKQLKKRKFLAEKYRDLYLDYQYGLEHTPDRLKAVYYGVKYICMINLTPETTYHDLLRVFAEIRDINCMISFLSISQVMNLFPITKDYDGKRYEAKDYYSTMEYLENKDLDIPLGDEVEMFFMNYYNGDIISYSIKEFLILDKLLKFEGREGLLEGALRLMDPDGKVDTYTYHKDEGYIYNQRTGKTHKVEKPKKRIPKYLKVIK